MSIRQAALVSEQLNQEIGDKPFQFAAHWWSNTPPKVRECEPTFTLDRQIAEARELMGEAKWQRLQDEWANAASGTALSSLRDQAPQAGLAPDGLQSTFARGEQP